MLTPEQCHDAALRDLAEAEDLTDMRVVEHLTARAGVYAELAKTASSEETVATLERVVEPPGWDSAVDYAGKLGEAQGYLHQIAGQVELLGSADPHEAIARVRVILLNAGIQVPRERGDD